MPKIPEMPMCEPTKEDRICDEAMSMRLLFHIPKSQPVLIWNVAQGSGEVYKILLQGGKNEGILH